MEAFFFRAGVALAGLGVGLGAFGAHGLRTRVSPDLLMVFETGVRYQMYHALALMALSLAWSCPRPAGQENARRGPGWSSAHLTVAGYLFIAGVALFSGSLYLITLTGARWWGAVTPFGGIAFIAGWIALLLAARA